MRRRRFVALSCRVLAAGLILWMLRVSLARLGVHPSVWLESALVFALAKAAGDAVAVLLFRDTIVLFLEDLLWEMVAFILLGLVAGGLIVLAAKLIGGPVTPYFPALVIYLVYLVAEQRQRNGMERG